MLAETTQSTVPDAPESGLRSEAVRLGELLAYEAPFLEKKLLLLKFVATREEARALLAEVKKYLYLADRNRGVRFPMPSLRVDETWHQLVLFTSEYAAFCMRFFGRYMHHRPSNAPSLVTESHRPEATNEELAAAYEATFGAPMPELWKDATSVFAGRRMIRNDPELQVRLEGGRAELVVPGEEGPQVLLRTSPFAAPALRFIAANDVFFVRELPGLRDDERVAVCKALMEVHTLRVAP